MWGVMGIIHWDFDHSGFTIPPPKKKKNKNPWISEFLKFFNFRISSIFAGISKFSIPKEMEIHAEAIILDQDPDAGLASSWNFGSAAGTGLCWEWDPG